MQETESLEPNKTFLNLTIIEYTIFSLTFSIVLIFSIFFNFSSLMLSSAFGFAGITLYILSSYFTQLHSLEKKGKTFTFASGMFSSFFRIFSLFIVFVAAASIDTFLPNDNTLDFTDTVEIVNLWLLLYYLSIPMISSFVFNIVYYKLPNKSKRKEKTSVKN